MNVKIFFLNKVPVVAHRIVESPLRIQRIDKATVTKELIAECNTCDLRQLVYSIDVALHVDYLLQFDNGEEITVKKWVGDQLCRFQKMTKDS